MAAKLRKKNATKANFTTKTLQFLRRKRRNRTQTQRTIPQKCALFFMAHTRFTFQNVNFYIQKTSKKPLFSVFSFIIVAFSPKPPYLCIVFFIVLDLRFNKIGVQRYPIFFALCRRADALCSKISPLCRSLQGKCRGFQKFCREIQRFRGRILFFCHTF